MLKFIIFGIRNIADKEFRYNVLNLDTGRNLRSGNILNEGPELAILKTIYELKVLPKGEQTIDSYLPSIGLPNGYLGYRGCETFLKVIDTDKTIFHGTDENGD